MERAPGNVARLATVGSTRATVSTVQRNDVPGSGDDGLNPPSVTPVPAPADDQLVKLAAVSSIVGGVLVLFGLRWLRRNIVISRRT